MSIISFKLDVKLHIRKVYFTSIDFVGLAGKTTYCKLLKTPENI